MQNSEAVPQAPEDTFVGAQERLLNKLMGWLMVQPEWPIILSMPREARKAAQREVIKMVYRMPRRDQLGGVHEE